ncbi:TetR family transcriptional regulator [Microlunatus sp. Gsoil 973]|jgi:AcrR family transcriptional regulator|uniref:acyl-CoA-like ligand-binding transcription factor n=1 Tax=Microlunatus sp. Gsoil 973 TaxID=2672569 RepID=UPI0012B49430|nr:TetR family transcriptional regulator [Microlunatus sp. Gsoil 973]QGN33301.1 TetR family transcriptional regulator [Microlunatus sp. Gsoil 973]
MTQSTVGLRALKKQLTRTSISNAALELTLENGFDQLTIDDIARRAVVSPRTFSNYFSCKEEAVVSAGNQYWVDVLDRLADRPADEHPLTSLRALLVEATSATDSVELQRAIQTMHLARRTAGLQAFQVALYARLEAILRTAVATRTGSDLEADMYPWLVAASAVAAMKSAMMMWLLNDAPLEQLPGLIGAAFDQVAGGLPAPTH